MVYRVADLREMARINLPEDCYKEYLAVIEPGVEGMLKEYLKGWQGIETNLTNAVMRHAGVYKTDLTIFDLDKGEYEKYADRIDIEKYDEYSRYSLKAIIDILLEQTVIDPETHKLFHHLRKIRNQRFHSSYGELTEQDRIDFEYGSSIAHYIYLTTSKESLRDSTREYFKKAIQNSVKFMLEEIAKRNST